MSGALGYVFASVPEAEEGQALIWQQLLDQLATVSPERVVGNELLGLTGGVIDPDAPRTSRWAMPARVENGWWVPMGTSIARSGWAAHPAPFVGTWPPNGVAAEWVQPTGAHDAYPLGALVLWEGHQYRSLDPVNVWSPAPFPLGFGWVRDPPPPPPTEAPPWQQPLGAQDAYPLGAIVAHRQDTWESTNAANVWEPGVFGWTPGATWQPPTPPVEEWAVPVIGAVLAAEYGARRMHQGEEWVNTVEQNVAAPGVYGWVRAEPGTG